MRSALGEERLDRSGVAHERDHHGDAADEENGLKDMDAVDSELEQIGDRPAARKGGAEHLGADQDGSAHDREHVEPDNPLAAGCDGCLGHGFLFAAAMSLNSSAGSSLYYAAACRVGSAPAGPVPRPAGPAAIPARSGGVAAGRGG